MCSSGNLADLCARRELTGRDLVGLLEAESGHRVSESTVSRWQRGLVMPSDDLAVALFAVAEKLEAGGMACE